MPKRELRSLEAVLSFVRSPDHDWAGVVLVGLDLRSSQVDDALLKEEFNARSSFLGCVMSGALARKVAAARALIVPSRDGLAFHPFRGTLYVADELLAGYDPREPASYLRTPDWTCYLAWMNAKTKSKRTDIALDDAVFLRLHDLAIEDALADYLAARPDDGKAARRVVGIMGGHDRERLEKAKSADGRATGIDAPYMKVAILARRLAREGFTIATGGGPGAMEASNLGAWFASRTDQELRTAVRMLERVPRVRPVSPGASEWNSGEWLGPAFEVMARFPRDPSDPRTESVGVPTWFYGHEPLNPFASHIAKFFENSVREEGVLGIATHGVIFAEGNAGTVQEIFQDGCQNYYATFGAAAPMVLLGSAYWNRAPGTHPASGAKSVWPLLQQLGAEKGFSHLLRLSDDLDEIVAFICEPPKSSAVPGRRVSDL